MRIRYASGSHKLKYLRGAAMRGAVEAIRRWVLDALIALDTELFRAVNHGLGSVALDGFMLFVTDRFTWIGVAIVAVSLALLRRSRRTLVFFAGLGLTLGAVDLVTYQVLKPAFERLRPCYKLTDVRLVQDRCGSDYGFPSNHAANGMATAALVALTYRHRSAWIAIGLAGLVGLSRVYVGVHFPGDVVAGFVVGGLAAWPASLAVMRAMEARHRLEHGVQS